MLKPFESTQLYEPGIAKASRAERVPHTAN